MATGRLAFHKEERLEDIYGLHLQAITRFTWPSVADYQFVLPVRLAFRRSADLVKRKIGSIEFLLRV
jgi:hypothetical protein